MSEPLPTADYDAPVRTWLRAWWVTLRYGSRFTKAGRTLRRNMRDDLSEYVEVERPRVTPPGSGDTDAD